MKPHREYSNKSGFALIISLAVMSLILLLILSMSSLIRVEMENARNQYEQEIARQNAKFALMKAIAQINKNLGPDQRTTARADILAPGSSTVANPYWIGVWDTNPNSPNYRKRITWLSSSSNEKAAPDTDMSHTSTPSADAVSLLGTASTTQSQMVKINKQTLDQSGHYAYWVSDEGLKHRVNFTTEDWLMQNSPYSYLSAQDSGLSSLPGFDLLNNTHRGQFSKIYSVRQLDILDQSFVKARKENYHSMTVDSYGLLTNIKSGGLKKDLTLGLKAGSTDIETITGSPYMYTINGQVTNSNPGGPKWEQLRSFYNLILLW